MISLCFSGRTRICWHFDPAERAERDSGFVDFRDRSTLGFPLRIIPKHQISGLPQEKTNFITHPPIVDIQHQKNPVTLGGRRGWGEEVMAAEGGR